MRCPKYRLCVIQGTMAGVLISLFVLAGFSVYATLLGFTGGALMAEAVVRLRR